MSDVSTCLRRSALFMPASNARALEKARGLDVDAVIMDLEDSVAPELKTNARVQAISAIKAGGYGPKELVLRANALDSEFWQEDIAILASAKPNALLVPKVETPQQILSIQNALDSVDPGGQIQIWVMMESPRAVLQALAIADMRATCPRLNCFVIGPNDLAKDSGIKVGGDRQELMPWLMTIVAAAKAGGLTILDGVYNAIADTEGFAAQCAQAARLGMDGKTLIHPSQITPCNTAFAPSRSEIDHAKRVVDAFGRPENATKGVIRLDGEMVERLHFDMALRVLAAAKLTLR